MALFKVLNNDFNILLVNKYWLKKTSDLFQGNVLYKKYFIRNNFLNKLIKAILHLGMVFILISKSGSINYDFVKLSFINNEDS